MLGRVCVCVCVCTRMASVNSPLNHEGPAGRRPPAAARRLAGLPLETSSVPLQTRWVNPCRDYLCGSSNPVSEKERERERNKRYKMGAEAMSVSRSSILKWKSAGVLCRCVFEQSSGTWNRSFVDFSEQETRSSGVDLYSLNVKVCMSKV